MDSITYVEKYFHVAIIIIRAIPNVKVKFEALLIFSLFKFISATLLNISPIISPRKFKVSVIMSFINPDIPSVIHPIKHLPLLIFYA